MSRFYRLMLDFVTDEIKEKMPFILCKIRNRERGTPKGASLNAICLALLEDGGNALAAADAQSGQTLLGILTAMMMLAKYSVRTIAVRN